MNNFKLLMTSDTPEVDFRTSGELILKGRSIPEDTKRFYDPLIDWVRKLECEKVQCDFRFEYVNSASSLILRELLTAIESNQNIRQISVNWYYEDDDLDILELGELYEEKLKRSGFNYMECFDVMD